MGFFINRRRKSRREKFREGEIPTEELFDLVEEEYGDTEDGQYPDEEYPEEEYEAAEDGEEYPSEEYDGSEEEEYPSEEYDESEEEEYPSGEYDGSEEEEYPSEEYDGSEEEEYPSEEYEDSDEEEYPPEEYDEPQEDTSLDETDPRMASFFGADEPGFETGQILGEALEELKEAEEAAEEAAQEEEPPEEGPQPFPIVSGQDPSRRLETAELYALVDEAADEEDEEEEDPAFFEEPAEKKRLQVIDIVLGVTGVLVLAALVFVLRFVLLQRTPAGEDQAFGNLGAELEGISRIGGDGIEAVLDRAKWEAENPVPEEPEAVEPVVIEIPEKTVRVSMNLSTILSDLKIKFSNEETGKLVANVAFEAEVNGPSGAKTHIDDDKDGIIYLTGLSAGSYKVSFRVPEGCDGYEISANDKSIQVKDQLEYKKVDVADEVKTEKEVNAAVEDTEVKEAVVESVNTDTVEWVESTKTAVGTAETWTAVEKSKVKDPGASAGAKLLKADSGVIVTAMHMTEGEDTVETEKPKIESASLGKTQLKAGETTKVSVKLTGDASVSYESGNTDIATIDSEGNIRAVSSGTVEIIVKIDGDSKTLELSVEEGEKPAENTGESSDQTGSSSAGEASGSTDQKTENGTGTKTEETKTEETKTEETATKENPKITLSATEASLAVGGTVTLKATVKPDDLSDKTVVFESADKSIATVSDKGVITGVKLGETTVTVTLKSDVNVNVSCKVKVDKDVRNDNESRLKDTSGNELYYKDGDSYKEAHYADYYKYDVFYTRSEEASEYKYTGWQTIDGKTYYFDKNGEKVTGEQTIQGVKYSFQSDGSLPSNSADLGIDVSKWNGTIDWNAVKNSGVTFAIIRCGYRGSSTGALIEDPTFKTNIAGAKKAGIKVGVYFFTQAVNEVEAVEEASMVLGLISGQGLNYPVFMDVEAASGGRANGLDINTRTAVIKAFCQTLQNSGVKAGVYANKTWLSEKMNVGALSSYKIWLAQYAAAPTYTGGYQMWQYSSKGAVSGIKGNVDMDISYLGL